MARILNVISAVSIAGGTPTKLRVLMRDSKHDHYLYHPGYDNSRKSITEAMPYYESIGVKAFYGIHNRNIIAHVKEISGIIREFHIDVVHFYFNFEQSFAPLLRLLHPNVKFVRSLVGYEKPLSWWRQCLMKMAFRVVDNYVFVSHYIEKLYTDIYPVLKKKNTYLIYNGAINVKKLTTACEDKKYVVSVGGLCERKNMFVLVEAMNIIKNTCHRDDIELYILGDGPDRQAMEELICKYELQHHVHLVGNTDKVADYLADCAVYVHPATTEGFGIAVVEAMQMHCACIVADKGALPELVEHEKNGYVIDAYDPNAWAEKIACLYDNKNLRITFGEESFKRAIGKFSLDSFVRNHDDFYDSLMENLA